MRRRWTPEEDALLGTDTDAVISSRLGRSKTAVCNRRHDLGIPCSPASAAAVSARVSAYQRAQVANGKFRGWGNRCWTAEEDALLGTASNAEVGALINRSEEAVRQRRHTLRRRRKETA